MSSDTRYGGHFLCSWLLGNQGWRDVGSAKDMFNGRERNGMVVEDGRRWLSLIES